VKSKEKIYVLYRNSLFFKKVKIKNWGVRVRVKKWEEGN